MRLVVNAGAGSFKSQLKKADKSGAGYALVLGEDGLAEQVVGLKPLRDQGQQQKVSWQDLPACLSNLLKQI